MGEYHYLRLNGYTWREIGDIYHINPTTIRQQVVKELHEERYGKEN